MKWSIHTSHTVWAWSSLVATPLGLAMGLWGASTWLQPSQAQPPTDTPAAVGDQANPGAVNRSGASVATTSPVPSSPLTPSSSASGLGVASSPAQTRTPRRRSEARGPDSADAVGPQSYESNASAFGHNFPVQPPNYPGQNSYTLPQMAASAMAPPMGVNVMASGPANFNFSYAVDPKDMEFQREAQDLVRELHRNRGNQEKVDSIKADLRDLLQEQFDHRMAQREKELTELRKQVSELEQLIEKRKANKQEIVDRRVTELSGGNDPLSWDVSGPRGSGPGLLYGTANGFGEHPTILPMLQQGLPPNQLPQAPQANLIPNAPVPPEPARPRGR